MLGDDYDDSLGRCADVEGETKTDGDDISEKYRTIVETQRAYVGTASEFHETRREYEAARRAGDNERVCELARELARFAEDGEPQFDRLLMIFDVISSQTDDDLTRSSTQIEAVQVNVSERHDEIVSCEPVITSLIVDDYDWNISFTDPLVLSGSLVANDGTPVTGSTVRSAVGG